MQVNMVQMGGKVLGYHGTEGRQCEGKHGTGNHGIDGRQGAGIMAYLGGKVL